MLAERGCGDDGAMTNQGPPLGDPLIKLQPQGCDYTCRVGIYGQLQKLGKIDSFRTVFNFQTRIRYQ